MGLCECMNQTISMSSDVEVKLEFTLKRRNGPWMYIVELYSDGNQISRIFQR